MMLRTRGWLSVMVDNTTNWLVAGWRWKWKTVTVELKDLCAAVK